MRKLTYNLLIFVVLAVLGGIASRCFKGFPLVPFVIVLVVVASGSGLSTWLLSRLVKNRPAQFLRGLMTTLFVRVVVYLIVIVLMVLQYRPDALVIAAQFAVVYIIFTVYEVPFLIKESKKM